MSPVTRRRKQDATGDRSDDDGAAAASAARPTTSTAAAASGGDHLSVVASGFLRLMASQLAARVLTFGLNLAIARHLTPEAYALSAVQFYLITTTILLLSREGFRRGCMRVRGGSGSGDSNSGNAGDAAAVAARVLAVSWLAVPAGALVAAAVCGFALRRAGAGADEAYRTGIVLHGVAALVELLAEPFYIIASTQLRFGLRAAVETAALGLRGGVTLVALLRWRAPPALAFSLAQLAFAFTVLAGYAAFAAAAAARGELPLRFKRWDADDRRTLALSGVFAVQAAEKLVLAEGSKLALVAVESGYNQGVYGLVANLGSLAVRLLLQPFEEAAFAAFSRAGAAAADDAGAGERAGPATRRGGRTGGADARGKLAGALALLVRGASLVGLLAAAFGPPYAYALLRLVYGRRWADTEAPFVLGCYSGYILLLAVNGITEAFTHAVLDAATLRRGNIVLLALGAAHAAASVALVRAGGAAGLVAADALNMALRIAYSLHQIRRYFGDSGSGNGGSDGFALSSLLPARGTLLAACAAAGAAAASERLLLGRWLGRKVVIAGGGGGGAADAQYRLLAAHIGVGGAALAAFAAAAFRAERGTAGALLALRRGGGGDSSSAAAAAAAAAKAE